MAVEPRNAGMTLVELVIALAIVGVMVALATATLDRWADGQRAATTARSIADAFSLARAEAIRTGSNHFVAFDVETGLAGITSDIVIVNDGAPGAANCRIDADEIVHRISLERGVAFGSDPGLANGAAAPDDSGTSGNQSAGSSFTTAAGGDASWVLFMADGLPRHFTQNGSATPPCTDVGPAGDGGGGIYVTNGRRDYAVVLSPLGTSRVHRWNGGGWTR